jgi:hypothetical protein
MIVDLFKIPIFIGNIDVEKINDYSSNSVEIIKGLKLEKKLIKSKALS